MKKRMKVSRNINMHSIKMYICLFITLFMLTSCYTEGDGGHNHQLSHIDKVDATCTTEGLLEHYECTSCGKYFSDKDGKNEITEIVIPLTDHMWTNATCTTPKTCIICGTTEDVALDHNESDWIVDKQATTTTTGKKHTECTICHIILKEEIIPIAEHIYSDWIDVETGVCVEEPYKMRVCLDCGLIEFNIDVTGVQHHNYQLKEIKQATCEEEGYCSFECSVCKTTQKIINPALGHTYQWIKTEEEHYQQCQRCNDIKERGIHTSNQGATCEENEVCKICGYLMQEKLGHTYISIDKKEATCTENGHTSYQECSRCLTKIGYQVILALGHSISDWMIDKEATCTTEGKKHKECTKCGEVIEEQTIPMLAHVESDWMIDSQATCTTDGKQHKTCTICGKTTKEQTIPMKGHTWQGATCTTPKTCTTCGEIDGTALGHSESDWIVDSDSTCTTEGKKHKECTRCRAIFEEQMIPIKDHIWTNATCTTPKTCTICGTIEGTPLEHSESDWIIDNDSTCTIEGKQHKECTRCRVILEEQMIPTKEHMWTNATCTTPKTCPICGTTEGTISGHQYDETSITWEWSEDFETAVAILTCKTDATHQERIQAEVIKGGITEATCTTSGECTYEAIVTTSSGQTFTTSQTEVIESLGHDFFQYEPLEATCTKEGHTSFQKCSRCSEQVGYEIVPALGHMLGEWIIQTEATCMNEGREVRNCLRCYYFQEENFIPRKAHEWIDATCAAPKTCINCGTIEGTMLPHTYDKTSVQWEWSENDEEAVAILTCKIDANHQERVNATITKEEIMPATCIESGKVCCIASVTYYDQTFTIRKNKATEPLGHDFIQRESLEPTCIDEGHTSYQECSRCQEQVGYESMPILGHELTDWIIQMEPTCMSEGIRYKACIRCDSIQMEEFIPMFEHTWVEATCTNPKMCIVCGMTEGFPLSHLYDDTSIQWEWSEDYETAVAILTCKNDATHQEQMNASITKEEVKQATCTESGETTYIAAISISTGQIFATSKTKIIEQLGHDTIYHELVEATCMEEGHNAYETCTRCDYTTYQTLPALGHNASGWVIDMNATCTSEGRKHTECTRCNIMLEEQIIPIKDHRWTEANCLNPKTCDSCGMTEGTALGHQWLEGWAFDEQTHYHTCLRVGCSEKENFENHQLEVKSKSEIIVENNIICYKHYIYELCLICGYENILNVGETTECNAPIEILQAVEPTCTESGWTLGWSCSNKDHNHDYKSQEVIPPLGHLLSDWIIDKEATCSQEGKQHKECTRCKVVIEEKTIEKLEHTWIDATCAAPKTCTVCGATEGTSLDHIYDMSNIKWEWSGSYGEAVAILTCTNDKTHQERIQAVVTKEEIDGAITYIATITYHNVTYTDRKTITYSQGLEYTLSEDGTSYIVTGIGTCTDTTIMIPSTYNQLPVTSIGEKAFSSRSSLISIIIPDGIIHIGIRAFSGCRNLTSITLPNSVKSIGESAFSNCNSLNTVIIPDGVTSIECNTFYYCNNLTEVIIPSSVTTIGRSAFSTCKSLSNIVIPDSVTSIEQRAFEFCYNLTSITLGNRITKIGNFVFDSCNTLTTIKIPASLTSFGLSPFDSCSGLISIVVDENNPVFDSRENCNAIIETATNTLVVGCQNTIIPNSVTIIGEYAFHGCSTLKNITIPNSVTKIDDKAFGECTSLTSIIIPDSVTSLGNTVFALCTSLIDITLSNSITSIGEYVFQYCSSLISITIPNSVTCIGRYVFEDCSSLTSITIPSSVTEIGTYAFNNCKSLTSVTFMNTNGWFATTNYFETTGTTLDVTNAATNAINFISTYKEYYWKRS